VLTAGVVPFSTRDSLAAVADSMRAAPSDTGTVPPPGGLSP
jgi:hypothetical protein